MKKVVLLLFVYCNIALAVSDDKVVSEGDLSFLRCLTKAVLDSSTINPNQYVAKDFGYNNTGGKLILPGGRACYPSFWIRDYAMSLNTGMIDTIAQKHMLMLVAKTQCNQTWISEEGAMIPMGAIADHIRVDNSLPIYYPGTYDYEKQGNSVWGKFPPYCDQFFFIHMAYYFVHKTNNMSILYQKINGIQLINRLELAFKVPPVSLGSDLVYATEDLRGVDFGFRDCVTFTGKLCMPSILKYKAAIEMSEIFNLLGMTDKQIEYSRIANSIKKELPKTFQNSRGLLRASTGLSSQADVWSTALAIYYGMLEQEDLKKAAEALTTAYHEGTLAYQGNVRHILTSDDYNENTAWERTSIVKNIYQNGAYWGTATGWVCYAIALVDRKTARCLVQDYVSGLKKSDARKGIGGGPYECLHPSGYVQNPLYLTTVACPFSVFIEMYNEVYK